MPNISRRSAINLALAAIVFPYRSALASPVDARSSGIVPPLQQPGSMTCWATVATMMYSWKNNQSVDIDTALSAIGQTYLNLFRTNQGLSAGDKPGFLLAAGLKAEGPQNYTAEGWAGLIQNYGPLWVTTNEGALSANVGCDMTQFAIHARILTAIFGDGTPMGTSVVVVDPADGSVHTDETLLTFVQKFEDVARIDQCGDSNADLRPQVVHY
jgi:hypothetical protein